MSLKEIIKDVFDFSDTTTYKSLERAYRLPPSISSQLRWEEYDEASKSFLLSDGKTVGAIYEIKPLPTEARTLERMDAMLINFRDFITSTFPPLYTKESPWIVQIYLSDEFDLSQDSEQFVDYVKPHAKHHPYSQAYQLIIQQHYNRVAKPGGIFNDELSGIPFQGRHRRTRIVIYRPQGINVNLRGRTPVDELNAVCKSFESQCAACGLQFNRYSDEDFFQWLARWFNPHPAGFANTNDFLKNVAYPTTREEKLETFDLSQQIIRGNVRSEQSTGTWWFDDEAHQYLAILGLSRLPRMGHLTAEQQFDKRAYALFDKFPPGCTFVMTMVMQSKIEIEVHLDHIEKTAKKSKLTDGIMAGEEAKAAKMMLANGNPLLPCAMGVYLHGKDLADLDDKRTLVNALLSSEGFIPIRQDDDLALLKSYWVNTPFNYDYQIDRKYLLRSHYLSAQQIAKILPFCGRETGSGNPVLSFFNRMGTPLSVDRYNKADKSNNSHLLMLGTTGAGKSATMTYLMMQTMAVYMPYLVVIDAGKSFALLMEFFRAMGLSVNAIEITLDKPTFSLNPFIETQKMLSQVREAELQTDNLKTVLLNEEEEIEKTLTVNNKNEVDDELEAKRNYLSEFATAATLMITGGESKEIDNLTRQDRYQILQAIVRAGKSAIAKGFDQMIASDLVEELERMSQEYGASQHAGDKALSVRLQTMAHGLGTFTQSPLNSMYFNTRGKPLPKADVTWFEMGVLKDDREENEAPRALAFITLMNRTMSFAEENQYGSRFTEFVGDELHVVTKQAITAASITQCSKMSRKVGLWLTLATQNVSDFPASSRKMLSMMEFWLCLGMSDEELRHIEEFRQFTDEERALFKTVRKEPGKYVEGVLLSKKYNFLYRNVPPVEALALAMTEKDEKTQRRTLMQEFDCDELEAAFLMAQKMKGNPYDLNAVKKLLARDIA